MQIDSDSDQPGQQEEEGVWKILTRQQIEGVEDSFLVQLVEGGKKVRRSRTELSNDAPKLLAEFDRSSSKRTSSSKPVSTSTTSRRVTRTRQDDSDIVMSDSGSSSSARVVTRKKMSEKRKTRSSTSTERSRDDSDAEEEEEGSSSSEEGDDGSGGFQDDSEIEVVRKSTRKTARKSMNGGKKPKTMTKESTRQSSRSKGSRPDYTQRGIDEDEDEEMEIESQDEEKPRKKVTTRSKRRSDESEEETQSSEGDVSIQGGSDDQSSEVGKGKGKGREVIELSSSEDESNPNASRDEDVEEEEEGTEQSREQSFDENRPQDQHYHKCAKCDERPASVLLAQYEQKARNRRGTKKKKKRDDDAYDTDERRDMDEARGAWVECETCVSAYHFGCLSAPVQKILKTRLDTDHAKSTELGTSSKKKREKLELDTDQVLTVKKCPGCEKPAGILCFVCDEEGKRVTEFERDYAEEAKRVAGDSSMKRDDKDSDEVVPGLMFRCLKCKRSAHYGCLDRAEFEDADTNFLNHTQSYFKDGVCHNCHLYDGQWQVEVDVILGWRESDKLKRKPPKGDKIRDSKTGKEYVLPSAKDSTYPAEYLVKWKDWSYRDLDWVSHSWLATRYQMRLSNFLSRGSTISFEPAQEDFDSDDDREIDAHDTVKLKPEEDSPLGPAPDPDIESRIPKAWKTVDRVIRVTYLSPVSGKELSMRDYKSRSKDDRESVKHVKVAFIKWGGLPYSQATEQEPPREGEEGYDGYFKAYQAYVVACSREMRVPRLAPSEIAALDEKRPGKSPVFTEQPETVTQGQLMGFQVEGLNFLLNHWWVKSGCILADEMGLGKTCQLICFLSYLSKIKKAKPFLIVVPNSLVSNWLREFEKWAPDLRTVAYNGDAESRRIVENFEMYAENGDLKTHVVITTYEALKNHANVFVRCPRWDCVVIDEGQALKSGQGNKLWEGIARLRIGMKILLTGTPLNNTLKELYNLLNFLDPKRFANVDELADPTIEMTPERVEKVRSDLRPYMLRRTKDEVLNLPPLGEFVVPVSLTLLQRQLYRGILEKNSAAILALVNNAGKSKSKAKVTATSNTLMTLRKISNHPYLHVPELDPGNSVPPSAAFRQLTDASAKLVLLEKMLPKLQQQGHKVLIFSQFKIVLNKLGPFLDGLGQRWLRLDGDTPQLERQRDVDRFNDPNSPYSTFILSTRAGGVGLTLTAADVVIIFDQDFNPFQDMQAIARAHRIGQKNPVRVFRLVAKGTCEEKILASGQKKQGLEHLIIQRIDAKDDETENVASALQYGAQAILEADDAEAEKAAKRYTDVEIDELLLKTAKPLDEAAKKNAGAFAVAQVWVSEKSGLRDASQIGKGVEAEQDLGGFWDRIVANQTQKEQEQKEKEEETNGRARRARKAVNYQVPVAITPMTDAEKKKRKNARSGTSSNVSSGDEFRLRPEHERSSSEEFVPTLDAEDRQLLDQSRPRPPRDTPDANAPRPGSSKSVEEAALVKLQKKKLEKRKRAILPLIEKATALNHREVLETLDKAMVSSDANEQKTLLQRAKRLLDDVPEPKLHERKDLDNRPNPVDSASIQPPPKKAEELATTAGKRKSDSPAELSQKRPKVSPPIGETPSTQVKPKSSSSKPRPSVAKPSAPSMVRSDSKSSGSDDAKKSGFSQPKLSFAAKPPSSTKVSSPTASGSATVPPAAKRRSPPRAVAPSTKVPAAPKPAPSSSSSKGKGSEERTRVAETIVISDSEED